MKKLVYLALVVVLLFSLTACDQANEVLDQVSSEMAGKVEGTIDESAVLCDNADMKITVNSASYSGSSNGILLALDIENKLDSEVKVGFNYVNINGLTFDSWEEDMTIAANAADSYEYKMVGDNQLEIAGITKLSRLQLGCYYYTSEEDVQYLDFIEVSNSKNPNYEQTVDFSGKDVKIDYGQGTLTMTFGVDKLIMDEEYGDAELYVLHENKGEIPVVIYYEAEMKDGNNPYLDYCGPALFEEELYMESLPFNGGNLDTYEGVTIKNLVVVDYDDNELFSLDELFIAKDDLAPASY